MPFTDQLGALISLPNPPQRIVSLVPSQTEFLFDIGLEKELVGITRFCIHPADKVGAIAKIGGTKQFDLEAIKQLKPDLIIGNKEENYEAGIAALQADFPVWMSDIFTLDDAYNMMLSIGKMTVRESESKLLVETIKRAFNAYQISKQNSLKRTAAYFIWRKPYMVAARHTFINELLTQAGFDNVFAQQERYPEVTLRALAAANPAYILLSSEPYSFHPKHFDEFQTVCPEAKVLLVDGEIFSWYGSRLLLVPAYFNSLQLS